MASLVAGKAKRGGFRPKVTDQQRNLVRQLVQANPNISDSEVADAAHISRAAAYKLRISTNETGDEAEDALSEFGRRIRTSLPVRDRVAVLTEIVMEAKSNPFVRLRAIEVTNELQGLVTRKQQREADQSQVMPQPIFVLPAGAALVSVQQPLQVVLQAVSGDVPGKDKAASD